MVVVVVESVGQVESHVVTVITNLTIGIKVLDLEQCPDIRLSDLQHLLTIKKVQMPASDWEILVT